MLWAWLSVIALWLPASVAAQSGTRELWGALQPGAHQVGFRQLLLRDPTRPALPVGGRTVAPGGRQMHIMIWYPARAGGVQLTYGDYLAAGVQRTDFAAVTADRRRSADTEFMARSAGFGGDTAGVRRAVPGLAATLVPARRGAPPAAGRFPLVIYPEWRPPASNSILAEYLASHGFVVATIAMHGATDDDIEYFAVRGIETLATDFAFVLNALDTVRYADTRNVATIGVGIAATGALALQMRTPAVRAFVSLEGGVTTAGEQGLLMRTPLFDLARVNVPMLAITAPHPSVDAARLDVYRYSTRYLAHFPSMGEFWFLDYGQLDARIPRIIGPPPGNTALGAEWGARLVERFLAAELRGDTAARTWIERATPPTATPSLFTFQIRRGLPAPPALADIKRMLDTGGVGALTTLVDARIATDPQPIPPEYFVNLNAWLADRRDADGIKRHALAALRVRLYPCSARAHIARAGSALRLRDSSDARARVADAVRLLATDADPLLDFQTRASIQRASATLGINQTATALELRCGG